jgi:hypothetical protein
LEMRERTAGNPFRGARPPSGAPAQQGRGAMAGVGHGAGAVRPPACVTVEKRGRKKRIRDG